MINCNEIQQEADELKMQINSCTILQVDHLHKIIDLILALEECKCNCTSTDLPIEIFSFQFDDLVDDITSVNKLTSDYLNINGFQQSEGAMIIGKNISFNGVGRYGFVINNTDNNPYQIFDALNNDVTSIIFDTLYDLSTRTFYYISKEYTAPSNLFFKFVKTTI